MFKLLQVVALIALSVSLAYGAPCVLDTAANYAANFGGSTGCTITAGSTTLSFSNFSIIHNASGSTAGGAGNQINLSPLADLNGLGFDIIPTTPFSANATGVNDFEVQFVASVVGGANLISNLFLSMTGSAGASGVGGGTAGADTLLEDFCRGGSLPPGSCPAGQGGTLVDFQSITGPAAGTTVTHNDVFAPTNALSILKDIQLSGNNGVTASSVTDVRNQITVIPEPSMSLVLGMALCGLIMFRRVRNKG